MSPLVVFLLVGAVIAGPYSLAAAIGLMLLAAILHGLGAFAE